MRTLSRRIFAFVLPVFAGAALVGCEEGPTTVHTVDTVDAVDTDPAANQHPGNSVGTVTLYELDAAGERVGVMGTIRIRDTGSELIVKGNAPGFQAPDNLFTSLFYGVGSVSTGPLACLPTGLDLGGGVVTPGDAADRLTLGEMATAFWSVNHAGTGKLNASKDDHYVPATDIGTISIRDVTSPPGGRTGALQGPEGKELVACGDVQVNPGPRS